MNTVSNETKIKNLFRFFDRPEPGTNERIESDIERHRKGWGLIRVLDSDGKPIKGVEIQLKQKSHDFNFGCNAFKFHDFEESDKNTAYEEYFKRLFNLAVIPFFWENYEPEPGKFCDNASDQIIGKRRPAIQPLLEWCEDNQIRPKGHLLFVDNFVQRWVPDDWREILKCLDSRFARLGDLYGRRIDTWDVVNESSVRHPRGAAPKNRIMPTDYVFSLFKMAEKYFPRSTEFIYNDATVTSWLLASQGSSVLYLLLKDLISRGAKVDALGLQCHLRPLTFPYTVPNPQKQYGHFHLFDVDNYYNPARALETMDLYGKLNIPLHISEISFPLYSDLPYELSCEVQARLMRCFYRLWFSQKDCSSIVYWNLCDNTAFNKVENAMCAGFVDGDFNEKPSFKMLENLIHHEWHSEIAGATDDFGELAWNGFYGKYEMKINSEVSTILLTPRGRNTIVINKDSSSNDDDAIQP